MTDDDSVVAYYFDPTFRVAPEDINALAEEIGRADGFAEPFDAYTLELVVKHIAACYRAMQWMAPRGHLGADTLDRLADPLRAVLDLLKDDVNQTRLVPQLIDDGFGGIPTTFEAYQTTLRMLAAIHRAAPRAHQGRTRGRPAAHPEVNEAFRVAVRHFVRIFGDAELRGRAAWTRTKPPQAKHLSAVFLYGVMKLAAPDRPNLAEEVRNLMEKEVPALQGLRPGRQHP